MRLESLLGHLVELCASAPRFRRPLDELFQDFFAKRRYLGRRDRAWLSGQGWGFLRGRLRWRELRQRAALELTSAALTLEPEAAQDALAALPTDDWPTPCLDILFAALMPGSALHAAVQGAGADGREPQDVGGNDSLLAPAPEELAAMFARIEARLRAQFDGRDGAGGAIEDGGSFSALAAACCAWGLRRAPELAAGAAPLSTLACGWPGWLAEALQARLAGMPVGGGQAASVEEQIASFMSAAPLALRLNTLRAPLARGLERLRAELAAGAGEGAGLSASALAPEGVTLQKRLRLATLAAHRAGLAEVQDEGSQLITLALAPRPGWRVLDACAGGGGKALHMAARMENQGRIFASDLAPARLARLGERARRSGAGCVRPLPIDEAAGLRGLDAVLIDAPCSGLGTLRRHPELLWRASGREAERLAGEQLAILRRFAPCVRGGGLVLYATCSFLEIENDAVIRAFLAEAPDFSPEPPAERWRAAFAAMGFAWPAALERGATELGHQLLPGLHGCDGFFVAALRNTSA